jgi:cell division initiation protein
MLTPQDIQDKVFAKAVFGGYDMTAVDDFLEEVMSDYAALYKESAVLKSKIKVLVEKVEEYRSTEDAMRMALLTAQKMGDDLQAEAKAKSDAMLSDAQSEMQHRMNDYKSKLNAEEQKLQAAKARTESFIASTRSLMNGHVQFLSDLEKLTASVASAPVNEPEQEPAEAAPAAPKAADPVADAAREIDQAVSKIVDTETQPAAETQSAPKTDDADSALDWDDEPVSRPKFDFDNLEFGLRNKKD